MIATTTLNEIQDDGSYTSDWKKLLSFLGKTKPDDEVLTLERIFECNGLEYALWCLPASDAVEEASRLFAAECARSVLHLTKNKRCEQTASVGSRFAKGHASMTEFIAACRYSRENVAYAAAYACAQEAANASAPEGVFWNDAKQNAWDAEIQKQATLFKNFFCAEGSPECNLLAKLGWNSEISSGILTITARAGDRYGSVQNFAECSYYHGNKPANTKGAYQVRRCAPGDNGYVFISAHESIISAKSAAEKINDNPKIKIVAVFDMTNIAN